MNTTTLTKKWITAARTILRLTLSLTGCGFPFTAIASTLDFSQILGLKVTVADECAGSNVPPQVATAKGRLKGACPGVAYTLAITVEGAVETHNPGFDIVSQ